MAKVVLKNVRLSFPSLFETAKYKGKDLGKYEATFLLPKNHPQLAEIQKAVKEVGESEFGAKWSKAKLCLQDGDTKDYDGYDGHWSVKASTKKSPVLLDKDKSAIRDPNRLYAGCYVNASISVFAFANNYGQFISSQLNAIQFHRDGDSFGDNNGGYSDDDFDAEPMDSGFETFTDDEPQTDVPF